MLNIFNNVGTCINYAWVSILISSVCLVSLGMPSLIVISGDIMTLPICRDLKLLLALAIGNVHHKLINTFQVHVLLNDIDW